MKNKLGQWLHEKKKNENKIKNYEYQVNLPKFSMYFKKKLFKS